jgi:hypothetical protein
MIDNKLSPEMEKRKTELEVQFKEEFIALLKKYNSAYLEVKDHWTSYSECGEDIQTRIESLDKYDENGNMIEPGLSFDLGTYLTSD